MNYYYPNYQYQTQQTVQQIQNGGTISVPNIDYARNYIVMPGTTVTFFDENAPYVYTKTRKSQFDKPVFEKYRLVREEDAPMPSSEPTGTDLGKTIDYATKDEIQALRTFCEGLQGKIEKLTAELGGTDDE